MGLSLQNKPHLTSTPTEEPLCATWAAAPTELTLGPLVMPAQQVRHTLSLCHLYALCWFDGFRGSDTRILGLQWTGGCLVPCRRYVEVGDSMALRMAFEVSKPHASPSLFFVLPACSLRHEHSAFAPAILPACCLLPVTTDLTSREL